MTFPLKLLIVSGLIALASSAPAALTITQSGGLLSAINADGVTYNFTGPNRLVNGVLTAYSSIDGQAEALLSGPGPVAGTVLTTPPPGNRVALLSDNRLDTGVINQGVLDTAGRENSVFTFDSPIVNRPGADLVFFEFANAINTPDPVTFRINGVTLNSGSAGLAYQDNLTGGTALTSNTGNITTNTGTNVNVVSLATYETAANELREVTPSTAQFISGILLDLDFFGVAPGASITSLTFGSTNGGFAVDPVFIAGLVPEPSRAMLLALGLLFPLAKRRR